MIDDFNGDYRFLSNFAWSTFIWDSRRFGTAWAKTVEHVYQAEKATNHHDFTAILLCDTPGESKRAGRTTTIRPDWEEVKISVMRRAIDAKFRQNPDLAALLLATSDELLVEGNHWHDQFWGDCHCGRATCDLPGANWLGRLLMELRNNWYVE